MTGIHADGPVARAGADLEAAEAAVILVHGRGATAQGIIQLHQEFDAEGVAYLAPQAAQRTWYPQSFLQPIEQNEPWLSSALDRVGTLVAEATEHVPADRLGLVGFSQGGCLATEYAARNARRYGLVAALSGGLIGPEGTPRDYEGSFDGTPTFLGCSDVDPHIPLERVKETTATYERMDAAVDERIYEGMGHGINADEVAALSALVGDL